MSKVNFTRFPADSAAWCKASEPGVPARGDLLFVRLGRGADGFVFLGLVVLVIFILRGYDARTSWRGVLLLLGIVSVVGCLAWRPVRWRALVPLVRRLVISGSAIAAAVVVASDLPVFREILAADEAAWFQPGDPNGLADATRHFAGDPVLAERLGERLAGRLLHTVMAVTEGSLEENTRNES